MRAVNVFLSIQNVNDTIVGIDSNGKCCGSVTISVNTGLRKIRVYPWEGTYFAVCGNQRVAKFNGVTGEKVLDIDMRDENGMRKAM